MAQVDHEHQRRHRHYDPQEIISPTLDNNPLFSPGNNVNNSNETGLSSSFFNFGFLSKSTSNNSPNLSSYDHETLETHMKPVFESLKLIDAEQILPLKRASTEKKKSASKKKTIAKLRDDIYVYPIHNEIKPPAPQPSQQSQSQQTPPGRLDSSSSSIMSNVDPMDIDNDIVTTATCEINGDKHHSYVRYLHISETPNKYSVGIFVFPPHAKIPLHDHPNMCVLSRLLYGDVKRISLDLTRPKSNQQHNSDLPKATATTSAPNNDNGHTTTANNNGQQERPALGAKTNSFISRLLRSSSSLASYHTSNDNDNQDTDEDEMLCERLNLPHGSKRAFLNKTEHFTAPDVAILYPYEGNLHELIAGPCGCAILDVLLPPYDVDHDRDCTFYSIHGTEEEGKNKNNTSKNNGDKEECWIIPMEQPETFHCLSGRYGNIGAADDGDDDYYEEED